MKNLATLLLPMSADVEPQTMSRRKNETLGKISPWGKSLFIIFMAERGCAGFLFLFLFFLLLLLSLLPVGTKKQQIS
jgi:hypothetical protein